VRFAPGQESEVGATAVAVGVFAGWSLALDHMGLVMEEKADASDEELENEVNDNEEMDEKDEKEIEDEKEKAEENDDKVERDKR